MALIADFAIATALALLLPHPELHDAAKDQLAAFTGDLHLASCPALIMLLVSKELFPPLTHSVCFPQLCEQLLKNAEEARKAVDVHLPTVLAQLVLSNELVRNLDCRSAEA